MRPDLLWPAAEAGGLIEALARKAGLEPRLIEAPRNLAAGQLPDSRDFRLWMERAAAWFEIEAELFGIQGSRVEIDLAQSAPAMLSLSPAVFVALLAVQGTRAKLLAPDGSVRTISFEELRANLCREKETPHEAEVDAMLDTCELSGVARSKARAALLRERLHDDWILVWQLRARPGARFWSQMRANGLPVRLALLAGAHVVEYGLWLTAWWVIGQTALAGRLDPGWLFAWVLLLATMVPFRVLSTWSQGVLAVGCGGLLRQRLLAGAMKLDPERIRHEGAGQLLGRVLEAETLESLALSGGLGAGLAVFEIIFAAVVLGLGAGGMLHVILFLAWLALTAFFVVRYVKRREAWTEQRLSMTHAIVERMTGNRTRVTQELPSEWHGEEDRAVEAYTRSSADLDRANVWLTGFVPRGWLWVGLAGLAPAFLQAHASPAGLATGLGGLILGWQALRRLVAGAAQLSGAVVSWKQVAPFFHAAAEADSGGAAAVAHSSGAGDTVLEASDLTFRYKDRDEPVLRGIDLRVKRGDSLLLEGASGGGKSTLGALLTGLREPTSGLLLSGGFDRHTLGARGWNRRVACAPQYHENHVFTGSFAFNLLIGRHWPPGAGDLEEATEICRELGLSPLLGRMPGGVFQMVGETGWQLSQGERSRLYVARALLQDADLVVLDESFAALDPENLHRALECVLKRAGTLLVVAHP